MSLSMKSSECCEADALQRPAFEGQTAMKPELVKCVDAVLALNDQKAIRTAVHPEPKPLKSRGPEPIQALRYCSLQAEYGDAALYCSIAGSRGNNSQISSGVRFSNLLLPLSIRASPERCCARQIYLLREAQRSANAPLLVQSLGPLAQCLDWGVGVLRSTSVSAHVLILEHAYEMRLLSYHAWLDCSTAYHAELQKAYKT